MDYSILGLYQSRREHFRFKGNRPGESETTRINELALIGDGLLSLEFRASLFRSGFNTGQITMAASRFLSNASLAERAVTVGILDNNLYATHASGTLLEAIIGYWFMSGQSPKAREEIYIPWMPAVSQLFEKMAEDARISLTSQNTLEDMFIS